MKRVWKEASSVIIAAKPKSFIRSRMSRDCSLSVLALKRHSDSSVLPNFYVFPGGHTHHSDSSEEWRRVFSQSTCEASRNCFETLNANVTLPIFKSNNEIGIPKAISLRIAAIRETFEECGILLCKRFEEKKQDIDKHLEIESIAQWRQQVIADASNFIKLCVENKCYPNVTALSLWSNWKTPVNIPAKKFDVAFFLVVLEDCYRAIPDSIEIEEIGWYPPEELLNKSDQGEISLSHPQFYELSRLLHFKDVSELSRFAKQRNKSDCELFFPIMCFLDDQMVSILPGDELYPENGIECTLEDAELKERLNQSQKCHRLLISNAEPSGPLEHKSLIIQNVSPKYDHILPCSSHHITKAKPKNKL
nr:PREDICTED: nucleoside diphosphate-linked moiety X motif 19-like [Bemisia tabaci]